MNEDNVTHPSLKKNLTVVGLLTVLILSIPLIAMQFSEEVDWKLPDFIIIGVLVYSIGLFYVLISRKVQSKKQKIVIGSALLLALLYIWAELAVGIFTNIGS